MTIRITNNINFTKATRQLEDDLKAAFFMETQEIMADSQANYVPVVTGHLRSTGHVDEPQSTTSGFKTELGYRAHYAIYVHEAPPGYGQGRNKFLEKPFLAHARGFQARVATRMRALGRWHK